MWHKIIPRAALSLILGFVVTDSKLLCHLFFPCCYFYPRTPILCFSHQTIPVIKREKNKRCVSHNQLRVIIVYGKYLAVSGKPAISGDKGCSKFSHSLLNQNILPGCDMQPCAPLPSAAMLPQRLWKKKKKKEKRINCIRWS